jgi:hypothetical protein
MATIREVCWKISSAFSEGAQEVVYSPTVVIGMFAAAEIILYLAWLGNPRTLSFVTMLWVVVTRVPPGTIFTCRDRQVFATMYNPRTDEELTGTLAYIDRYHPSFLSWSGGPRAVPRMKELIAREFFLHVFFFIFLFIPIIVVTAWLAVAINWRWAFALIFFVEWEAIGAYLKGVLYLGTRSFFILLGLSLNQAEAGDQEHHWIASILHIHFPFSASLIIALFIVYVLPLLQARKLMSLRRQAAGETA